MIAVIFGAILGTVVSTLFFDVPLSISVSLLVGQLIAVGALYMMGYTRPD
jgi:hypothetical protein